MRIKKLNELRWKLTWKLRHLKKKYPTFSEPANMMLNDLWENPKLVKTAYKLASQPQNDYHRALYALRGLRLTLNRNLLRRRRQNIKNI